MAFCIDWLEVSRSVQLGHRRTNTLDVDASGNVLNIAGNAEIVGETGDGVFCRLFRQKSLAPCSFGFPRETNTLLTATLLLWLSRARTISVAPIFALPTVGRMGASTARWAPIPRSLDTRYWV